MDFLLIGGGSIIFLVGLYFCQWVAEYSQRTDYYIRNLPVIFSSLSLFINFPHFMATNQMAYGKGQKYIFKNWIRLIFLPIFLIIIGLIGFYFFSMQAPKYFLTMKDYNSFLYSAGIQIPFGNSVQLGKEILSIMINLMFLLVGWHYTKQAFGCMMVYSNLTEYKYTTSERKMIRFSLLSIWLYSYSRFATGNHTTYSEINYHTPKLPNFFLNYSYYISILFLISTLLFVFIKKYRKEKTIPHINVLSPYLSMFIWWLPIGNQNPIFYSYAVPFFHSLQYFPFVYKIIKGRSEQTLSNSNLKLTPVRSFIFLIFIGLLSFELIPELMDSLMDSFKTTGFLYWFIYFTLAINIHHYFVDNIIWRFNNEEIKRYLL
ncbi:MAG: hypothetical protein H6622_06765 [Halobacteriovoraceae bacterium]|nr:hypothetical protein [Halobacteriovoraceae bacterium]